MVIKSVLPVVTEYIIKWVTKVLKVVEIGL